MRNIGENEITNMGGDFNYINCECITDLSGEPEVNLFDKDNANEIAAYFFNEKIKTLSNQVMIYIPITGGLSYKVSKMLTSRFVMGTTETIPADGVDTMDVVSDNSATSLITKTSTNAKYLWVYCSNGNIDLMPKEEIINSIWIEVV